MVDPDAPSKKKSSKAQWLHWIVTNVEGRKVNNVGWILFVFHSFQPTPFLLGLVLSIGTSGSTEVGRRSLLEFYFTKSHIIIVALSLDYQARDYSTMGIYKMLVGHSMQITDGDEVMMYASPSPPKG